MKWKQKLYYEAGGKIEYMMSQFQNLEVIPSHKTMSKSMNIGAYGR